MYLTSSQRSSASYDTHNQPLSGKHTATFMRLKRESTEQGNLSSMVVIVLMAFFSAQLQKAISTVHTTEFYVYPNLCKLLTLLC